MKAILFDFDGTIVDTETAWYVAYREVFEQHGFVLSLEEYSQQVGTQYDFWGHLESLLQAPVDREAGEEWVEKRYQQLAATQEVRPGILQLIEDARANGLRIGLASSSGRAWVEGYLHRFGLLENFSCIFTKEDVEAVKPDPALYQKALQALGVEPQEAFALEDSPNGAKAAKAAGMHCVILPNELTKHFTFGDYDLRINEAEELSLAKILPQLTGKQKGIQTL